MVDEYAPLVKASDPIVIGAAACAMRHDQRPARCGVGTGFSQRRLEARLAVLRAQGSAEYPFDPVPPHSYSREATQVEPVLEAQIELTEFTNEGYVSHANFIARHDHDLPR
jgi:ATP-dependent DNA ligase